MEVDRVPGKLRTSRVTINLPEEEEGGRKDGSSPVAATNRSFTPESPPVSTVATPSTSPPQGQSIGILRNSLNTLEDSMGVQTGSSKTSSLDLRKLPPEILLMGDLPSEDDSLYDDDDMETRHKKHPSSGIVGRLCLNPRFELRTQFLLSFGSLSIISISFVVLTCILTGIFVGSNVKDTNIDTVGRINKALQGRQARYLADSLHHRLFPRDLSEILVQLVLDRFEGYPEPTDKNIPFRDMESGENIYPIVGPDLPLDWNLTADVTRENGDEHTQTRYEWYGRAFSTFSAMFHMQGTCDTSVTDPEDATYFEGCSDANNDISTGGIVVPSNLTTMIHRKSQDLTPAIKALYESNQDIRDLGLYFANGGAGASFNFPAFSVNGNSSYVSIGCDWMNTPNPYDPTRTIGTPDQVSRCRPDGTRVPSRVYNPLERAWCRDQALQPDRFIMSGPYVDAWSQADTWLFTIGKAVYDRTTKDFVACTYAGLNALFLEEILLDSLVYPSSHITIVRYGAAGEVIASTAWNITENGQPPYGYELDIGATEETFKNFDNLFDFEDSRWDPAHVRGLFESEFVEIDGFVVSGHPFPPIPDQYDEKYRPEFLIIISTPESDMFQAVEDANDEINDGIFRVILLSALIGFGGNVLSLICLVVMASAITAPLSYMNEMARKIVDSFGDKSPGAKDFSDTALTNRWLDLTPRTEITVVVEEFKKIVSSFSGGSLMAKDENARHVEVVCHFPLRTALADLYKGRENSTQSPMGIEKPDEVLLDCVNLGSNFVLEAEADCNYDVKKSSRDHGRRDGAPCSSPLFLWTVILIVVPLVITMIVIAAVSMTALSHQFDETIDESETFILEVEIKNLNVTTGLRADFASRQAGRSVRDLYLITRFASWLLFGGVRLSDSLPTFQNAIETCKGIDVFECPAALDLKFCDCEWNQNPADCEGFERHRQEPFIIVQSDSALWNGTRKTTSYPEIGTTPRNTEWWETEEMPGYSNASDSFGYETTFDRARVIAATSPIVMPIQNYYAEQPHGMGQFFAFHEDGLFMGMAGCDNFRHPARAAYQSNEENELFKINPELCPLGRYGYDPRCRDWYDSAKKQAHDKGISLYVTPPYDFVTSEYIAQSAAAPLVDPASGLYVGQALYDFSIDSIIAVLNPQNTPTKNGGFHLLITQTTDAFGGDVVIGPGYEFETEALPVAQVVAPRDVSCAAADDDCAVRQNAFTDITKSMKECKANVEPFARLSETGSVETLYMAYAPVRTSFLDPVDSSNFNSGSILKNNLCIYSLAVVETEDGLKQPFAAVEDDLRDQTRIAVICLACLVFFAIIVSLGVSYHVTQSVARPMQYLLDMILSIQRSSSAPDIRKFDNSQGSKEILNVSNTLETLFEVVCFANVAFYAGELDVAYRVLRDSLRIFRGMKNDKAISVTCNNLGNILLVMFLDMKHDDVHSKYGLSRQDIIKLGTAYYHEAIKLGEAAYDQFHEQEGWTPNCLDFMQHLSNRYFNRAMFLLCIKDDHEQPAEIERLGIRDLEIARDMDVEIVDQGEEVGWGGIQRTEKLFHVALTRVRGLILLLELGYPDEWNLEEKLASLMDLLQSEGKKESSELFTEISYVGRLQEVETELMKYYMAENDLDSAAKVAIRPLFEDEYLFAEVNVQAIQVLMSYVALNGDKWDASMRDALKKWLEDSLDTVSMGVESERLSSVSDSLLSVLSKSFVSGKGTPSIVGPLRNTNIRFSINDQTCVTMEKFF